ncbi:MAG: histidine kinase [Verrucomicrobiota bacterium]
MIPPQFTIRFRWVVALFSLQSLAIAHDYELGSKTLSELEQRLLKIDSSLENLASYSVRGGVGSIGYHSKPNTEKEWVEIDLGELHVIDEIIVVPTIRRDTDKGFKADAFPAAFQIIAGTPEEQEGEVIAAFQASTENANGIAPLVLPISQKQASWVRLEATQLTRRAHSGASALVLSEILVFSGPENVALRRPVKSSSNERGWGNAWDKRFLVDGHMPYLMNSAQGKQSAAYLSGPGEKPYLTIDLGQNYLVSRIQIHAVEQGDTVPQAFTGDLGFPQHLRILGATKADFTDAVTLIDFYRPNLNQSGPIMMWRIPEISCRFVNIAAVENGSPPQTRLELSRIGFAEIELFSNGENVALHAPSTATPESPHDRPLSALTDGHNYYGEILSTREWLNELATRYQLESERPHVIAELNLRYAAQKKLLERMVLLAILLAMGIAASIFIGRYIRMRQATRIRERIAADLHDELGADLHTIGLYSDLALDSLDSREELIESLQQIREFTERSGAAARHCTNILEAKGICEDLVEDIKNLSRRLLTDLHQNIDIQGEEHLRQLQAQKRIDLFLFYKECLTNILRHSEATKVRTLIAATNRSTTLQVDDNGKGFLDSTKDGIPPSLKRRARLMRAKVSASHTPMQGTQIILTLKKRTIGFLT